jgi:subtilisin family serine protease
MAAVLALAGGTVGAAEASEDSTQRYLVVSERASVDSLALPGAARADADRLPGVGAIVADLTRAQAATLDAQPGVTVAPDVAVSLLPDKAAEPGSAKKRGTPLTSMRPEITPTVSAAAAASSWGLDRIDQRRLPLSRTYTPNAGVNGRGVHVYVIDTGLATSHPEFRGRVGNGIDIYAGDSNPEECGQVPHGTHVAGTVASTLFGVARSSTLHGVRVLDCDGVGTGSDLLEAMDWVVEQRARLGRTVVANMSLSAPYNEALNAAAANMVRNGVVAVAAAGNAADNASSYSPASTPEAITVAASESDDSDAPYSNYGSIIDLYAPGSDIWSTYAYDPRLKLRLSGTSMAAPHVSGWAALYLTVNPQATPAQVRGALIRSGTTGMIRGEVGGTPDILPYMKHLRMPTSTATVRVVSRTALSVNVDPDRPGEGSWRVLAQRKQGSSWLSVWAANTQGAGETVRRDVRRGTWRIVVPAQHGHVRSVSRSVWVAR